MEQLVGLFLVIALCIAGYWIGTGMWMLWDEWQGDVARLLYRMLGLWVRLEGWWSE